MSVKLAGHIRVLTPPPPLPPKEIYTKRKATMITKISIGLTNTERKKNQSQIREATEHYEATTEHNTGF